MPLLLAVALRVPPLSVTLPSTLKLLVVTVPPALMMRVGVFASVWVPLPKRLFPATESVPPLFTVMVRVAMLLAPSCPVVLFPWALFVASEVAFAFGIGFWGTGAVREAHPTCILNV